jgi:transposase
MRGLRQLQVDISAEELRAIRAEKQKALARMHDLNEDDPEFDAARTVAICARILELAAEDQQSLRVTAAIAALVRDEFSWNVSVHMVRRTLHAWNDSGFDDALFPQRRGPKKRRGAEQAANLRLLVEQYQDATPDDLAEQLGVSRSHLFRLSRRAGIKFPRRQRDQSH